MQDIFDTYVPGAYYQRLAQQDFDAGNYATAGGYEVAALADALLGVATFGGSTRLRAPVTGLFRRSFTSFEQLKRHLGSPPAGMHWHHIVEQSQIPQFGAQRIHSIDNIVAVPADVHNKISGYYKSTKPFSRPDPVRAWLRDKSFEEQYEFGMNILRDHLGY
ncbi:MAG: hypothetical protein JOY64_03870 [Alphaproteobacteria bacterium]|nr:hypothetical protein [Alphaproteobacteria bacterium]MBV8406743.1 hypothetical protein [Alphaproteobacteria bacterium]